MKIKANEYLFNEWKKLGYEITNLSSMVQNDMEISDEELIDWYNKCKNASCRIKYLYEETYKEAIYKQS